MLVIPCNSHDVYVCLLGFAAARAQAKSKKTNKYYTHINIVSRWERRSISVNT